MYLCKGAGDGDVDDDRTVLRYGTGRTIISNLEGYRSEVVHLERNWCRLCRHCQVRGGQDGLLRSIGGVVSSIAIIGSSDGSGARDRGVGLGWCAFDHDRRKL